MADLGGAPVMASPEAVADEQVVDLSEFGAVALQQGAPADEEVFDLNEFGAVQLG